MRSVVVLGVGMVPFAKPGRGESYAAMGSRAARRALEDAALEYPAVEQAFVGYVYGDSTCGQAALYPVGMTGIPVINVNNNCSTGSTALYLARQAVQSGAVECALALGFEQMMPGALRRQYPDRPMPLEPFFDVARRTEGFDEDKGMAPQLFGAAARDYRRRFGLDERLLARISVKSRAHAAKNPDAVFRDAVTEDEVLASPSVSEPLTRLQCCPPTCGAAAAIVASEDFARRHGAGRLVRIAGQAMTTDRPGTFAENDMRKAVGFEMSQNAAAEVYRQAGLGPEDLDVIELHDCFTINELISYEALGLAQEGEGSKLIADGDNTFGGCWVVNPSGGLISKGHPLGATGLAQCYELVAQLRGTAGARQVPDANIALQHNIGLGGACVVTLYARS